MIRPDLQSRSDLVLLLQLNYKKHHKLVKAAKKRKGDNSSSTAKARRQAVSRSASPEVDITVAEADNSTKVSDQDIISQLLG